MKTIRKRCSIKTLFTLSHFRGKKRISCGMEIVPAFFVADKTRASLGGKSRAVHKVDAHPRWRVVSALKE